MSSIEQGNTMVESRNAIYTSSSAASKGLMNVQRPVETRMLSSFPVSTIIRQEPAQERIVTVERAIVIEEARAVDLEAVVARPPVAVSNKEASEASSETSYDSKEDKAIIEGNQNKPVVDVAGVNKEGETVGVVEVKGFGARDHFLSEGFIVFRVQEAKFRANAKVDTKHKPYLKFRLGFNSKNSKTTTIEGNTLKCSEEVKVKYSNQDQVQIKLKSKGKLVDNVIARTKVSIVDVVMEGKQVMWVPLLKGDNVIGEMKLEMEFAPKK